ncbi:YbhN family protein [Actinokineospora auranticolor]|uniref:Lysylphosphatidylglycerol synthase-like protein n=1 Tax=Actinokineospora auranticolor TaxID=155976 RepID=A0A2S6GDN9_9PSEU|nr:YbhN family protein [Actinokineospora auranticolor]PPK63320.1 hypothetical protein CLV40_12933 [Actinokineospora auranticolor]
MTTPALASPPAPRPVTSVLGPMSIPTPATRPEPCASSQESEESRPTSGEPHSRPRALAGAVRSTLVVLALVAAGWFAVRSLPSWSSLVEAFTAVDLPLILLAACLQVGSLWMFAKQQQALLAGFGVRVPTGSMLAITYSRSAMSMTLPAGTVVSALFAVEQYRRFGASRTTTATVTVASGVVSALGLASIYLGGLAVRWTLAQPWHTLLPALLAIGAAAAVAVHNSRTRGPARPPVRENDSSPTPPDATRTHRALVSVRAALRGMRSVPLRSWLSGLGYASANWTADLLCLITVTAAFDVTMSPVDLGLLYLGIQLVRQIPMSPGGIGVIEVSLIAGLGLLGTGIATAAAITLVYRLLSCWLVIPPGLATWFTLNTKPAAHNGNNAP